MSKLNPPKELRFDGNLSQNWERWKREFKFYMTATESNEKGEDVKTSMLLTTIGERAREIYYTFTFANEDDAMKLDPVVAKFDEYMKPKKNIPLLTPCYETCLIPTPSCIPEYFMLHVLTVPTFWMIQISLHILF